MAATKFDAIPQTVLDHVKLLTLDCVGNMIGGTTLPPARAILELVGWFGGTSDATVFATGSRTSVGMAAYANSSLANLLDFDDVYGASGHLGATAIPTALAVGESLRASGREVLAASVVGYEVSGRVGEYMRPSTERGKDVLGFSSWQTFGAAAAAANLLQLDEWRVRHALGTAGLGAPVPNIRKLGLETTDRPVSWTKNNYGMASLNGVIGAHLASQGFVGNAQILDGDRGFWRMAGSDRHDPDALVSGLGRDFVSLTVGVKPYACCRWTHAAVEAAEKLAARGISGDQVRALTVETFREATSSLGDAEPRDVVDAQFSLPYLVALTLYGRSPAGGLSDEDLERRDIRYLARRTKVAATTVADALYTDDGRMSAEVTIYTDTGHEYRHRVVDPLGDPSLPMTGDDIERKFMRLAGPVVGEGRARRIREDVGKLDEWRDVAEMVASWSR